MINYTFRNALNNLATTYGCGDARQPICPRCHTPLKRIHRTYVDDDDRAIQSEILWKCACSSGNPIPVALERHREDFPMGI